MSDQNVDVVRTAYAAFGRGDIEGIIAVLDPAIEWVSPGPSDLPSAGTRRGHDAVREFFRIIGGLFDFQRFEPKTFIAQGEHVIVLGEDTATVRATGKTLDSAWVHHMTFKNGKVVAMREYLDTADLVAEVRAAQAHA